MTADLTSLKNEAKEFRLTHDLSVQLMKEFNLRAAALKRSGEEIVELRRQIQLLQNENGKLREQIESDDRLAEDVRNRPPPAEFENLGSAELALRLQTALQKYRDEKGKSKELQRRLDEAMKEVARGQGLERTLDDLERTHMQQNTELQRLQEENRKIEIYRQTVKSQEKVISKLEKVLEGSLDEVQKAQRTQVDMERLKTENVRLREQCANLAARRKYQDGGEEDLIELRQQIKAKDEEITRLEALVSDLQTIGMKGASQKRDKDAEQKLDDMEMEKTEWQQKCQRLEQRLQMMEKQLTENSKQYGKEISNLKVEIAKRDAKVIELEMNLQDAGQGL
jgi:chromosome segregation ATPase